MFSGWRRVWQSSQGGGGKYSANVQWLEEGVAVKPGWRGEVQSLGEMRVGVGGYPRGADFSRVTAAGMKLFLNLLVRERRTL